MGKNKNSQKFANEYHYKDPLTYNQKAYCESIYNNFITIAEGPSGVGKTLFALQHAIKAWTHREIDSIFYVRNNCDKYATLGSKGRGFLPGGIDEKSAPLLGPVYDNLIEIVCPQKAQYIKDTGVIQPLIYDDLRGRSFSNCVVIADEAQNVPLPGIVLMVSRMGRNSKLILLGDVSQKDTANGFNNGLHIAKEKLRGTQGVGTIQLGTADIQRHSMLGEILTKLQTCDIIKA